MSTKACNALFVALREVSTKSLTLHQNPGNPRYASPQKINQHAGFFRVSITYRVGKLPCLAVIGGLALIQAVHKLSYMRFTTCPPKQF